MITPHKNCSALILSAGVSSRMGFPKAFLKWDENMFFLEKIVNEYYAFSCAEVIVVVNHEVMEYYNVNKCNFLEKAKVVINEFPELPRFHSIRMGINEVTTDFCFVQNSDNPFTDQKLLSGLYENRLSDGYVSPVFLDKSGHPVLLGIEVRNGIKNTKEEDAVLSDILAKYTRKKIQVANDKIFCNINTPEEYEKYFNNKKM